MGKKNRIKRAKQPPPLPPRPPPPPPPPAPAVSTFESDSQQVAEINNEISRLHNTCLEALAHSILAARKHHGTNKEIKALTKAVRSAKSAVNLLPNSVELSFIHTVFLWRLVKVSGRKYDDVIEACRNTLEIQNPDDSVLGSTLDFIIGVFAKRDNWRIMTKDSKILVLRGTTVKILVDSVTRDDRKIEGEEKEDNMIKQEVRGPEMTAKQAEGEELENNMIKQDVIDLEERKEQIYTIIRELEQQMTYSNDEKSDKTDEKLVKYNTFWNSGLSSEAKRDFLKVNIEELKRHVKSLKNQFLVEILSEALSFAKEYKTWRFFECFCSEKFAAAHLYKNHFWGLHWENSGLMEQLLKVEITNEWIEMIKDGVWRPLDTDMVKEKSDSNSSVKWPLCDYSARAELLGRIRKRFLFLLEHRLVVMAKRVVYWVIQFANCKFEAITSLSRFSQKINEVICCLGASQLQELLRFMHELVLACGLDKSSSWNIFLDNRYTGLNINERIVFNGDFSCLLLDKRLLRGELTNVNHSDVVTDDGSAVTSAVDVCEDDVLPDGNELVSWLYSWPTIEDYSRIWTRKRNSKRGKTKVIFEIFEQECLHLKTAERGLSKLSGKMEAVQAVDIICKEEIKNREQCPERVAQPYLELLKKEKKNIQRNADIASKTKSDTISQVLNEAEAAVSNDQSGFEEQDNCIKLSLQKLQMEMLKNMAFVDAAILRRLDIVVTCKLLIEKLSLYDFRSMIVLLLKSFLQAHLEDLFDKDYMEKHINKDWGDEQQKQDNKRKKKKKKNFRKAEESKAKDSDNNFQLPQKEAELDYGSTFQVGENEGDLTAREVETHPEHQKQLEDEASLGVDELDAGSLSPVLRDDPTSQVGENAGDLIARDVEAHPEHQKQHEHEASLGVDELDAGSVSPVLSADPTSHVGKNAGDLIAKDVEAHPEYQKKREDEASLGVDELDADSLSPVPSDRPNLEVTDEDDWAELQRLMNDEAESFREWKDTESAIEEGLESHRRWMQLRRRMIRCVDFFGDLIYKKYFCG